MMKKAPFYLYEGRAFMMLIMLGILVLLYAMFILLPGNTDIRAVSKTMIIVAFIAIAGYCAHRLRVLRRCVKERATCPGRIRSTQYNIFVCDFADATTDPRHLKDQVYWITVEFTHEGKKYEARHYIPRLSTKRVLKNCPTEEITVLLNTKDLKRSYCIL